MTFNPAINIFIGPNSSGKTTILKLLKSKGVGRIASHTNAGLDPMFSWLNIDSKRNSFEAYIADSSGGDREANAIAELPLIWIPANRVPLMHNLIMGSNFAQVNDIDERHEIMNLDDRSDSAIALFASEVSKIANAYFADRNIRLMENAYEVGERAFSCTKEICTKPQILTGSSPFHYVDVTSAAPVDLNKTRLQRKSIPLYTIHHLMALDVTDDPNSRVYAGNLSSGVQDLYIWILYMAFRLAYFYGWQDDWHKKPGVLLIDEIENHLHPNWQRRVIDVLKKHFPGLQIFATTHSPFLVSGRQTGQVHMCGRDADGRIFVRMVEDDVFSWSADEILSEFMEVDYPTDLTTEQAVKIVLWLEENAPLEGKAEEWRLSQIDRLEAEERTAEAVDSEIIMLQWLRGEIKRPVELSIPLEGGAEEWRLGVIEELKAETGTDIFAGGAIAAQRELLERYARLLQEDDVNDDTEEDAHA